MGRWVPFPLAGELNKNVDGTALTANAAEIQNAYLTEAKALARFPQLRPFITLNPQHPVFLEEWRKDLIAVCGGRTFLCNLDGTYQDKTGAAVEGGKRVIFAKTENELAMAAGRQIIRYQGDMTTILSAQAPESTHIGWVSGYLVALEKNSGRFRHSNGANYTEWDALNTFSAEGKPDDLTALLVTEFVELLLAGEESIEQFDPSPSGDQPFYRRWTLGVGTPYPYTFISVDNRSWGVNNRKEFVAFSTQTGAISSGAVQKQLENIDDWTDAFCMAIPVDGQRYIILRMPFATNSYGTKGVTYAYDYRRKHWHELFGFEDATGLADGWQGWSYKEVADRKFIGGKGIIYELGGYDGSYTQKMLWRSGFIKTDGGQFSIEKVRLRVKRGTAAVNATNPAVISLRCNKNNRGFGRYVRRDLGKAGKGNMVINYGNLGVAENFQLEIEVTDNSAVEISGLDIYVENMDE